MTEDKHEELKEAQEEILALREELRLKQNTIDSLLDELCRDDR